MSTSQCNAKYQCINRVCAWVGDSSGYSCTATANCLANEVCVSGVCVRGRMCLKDSDCGYDKECIVENGRMDGTCKCRLGSSSCVEDTQTRDEYECSSADDCSSCVATKLQSGRFCSFSGGKCVVKCQSQRCYSSSKQCYDSCSADSCDSCTYQGCFWSSDGCSRTEPRCGSSCYVWRTDQCSSVVAGSARSSRISRGDVWFDLNGNGELDAGEPSTKTDHNGNFFLIKPDNVDDKTPVIIADGVDIELGLPIVMPMKAFLDDDGHLMISPFATIVSAVMQNADLDLREAGQAVPTSSLHAHCCHDDTPSHSPRQLRLRGL